jgi:uncharacterized protein YacL
MAAGAFFAFVYGLPQLVWNSDLSHMTSVIAGVFVASCFYLGWLSWNLSPSTASATEIKAEWGWFAEEKFVRMGLFGTVIGLILQAKVLATGSEGLGPLSTAFMSTAVGVLASFLLALLAFNITSHIERMKR